MRPLHTSAITIGYFLLGRSFAYFGLPSAGLYVGEIVLVLALILRPVSIFGPFLKSTVQSTRFSGLSLTVLAFLGYGLAEAGRGLIVGHAAGEVGKNLVFNYYPLFLFVGCWSARYATETLFRKAIFTLAWANGVYGVAYIAILSRWEVFVPGTLDIPLFGQPGGSAVAMLGMLCVERRTALLLLPMALNFFVMLGIQVRAEYLGFALALLLWAVLKREYGRFILYFAGGALVVVLAVIVDFRIPSPRGRGGEFSVRGVLGRVISAFDRDAAMKLSESAGSQAGTITWRTEWWGAIWDEIHKNNDGLVTLFGLGYGFPINSLVPYVQDIAIRSPHNVFYYALGFGGWVGVGFFALLNLAMLTLLWRTYKINGQPFGLLFWALSMTKGMFGNFFETPFGAIPFYLVIGMCIAPIIFGSAVDYACPPRRLSKLSSI